MARVYFVNRDEDVERRRRMRSQYPNATRIRPLPFEAKHGYVTGNYTHGSELQTLMFKRQPPVCKPSEYSLTVTHLSAVGNLPLDGRPSLILEDDTTFYPHTNPSVIASSPQRLESFMERLDHIQRPVNVHRTTLSYWLWPLTIREICSTAFKAAALTVDFQTVNGGIPLSVAAKPYVADLPIYPTSFGAAGSGALWYSSAAVLENHLALDQTFRNATAFEEFIDAHNCALDLLLNDMGSFTMWPAPAASYLPGGRGESFLDIRGDVRREGHTSSHIAAHERWLEVNLRCEEIYRQQMIKAIDQNAWTGDAACEAYIDTLVAALRLPRMPGLWLPLGFMLWALIEVVVRYKKVR